MVRLLKQRYLIIDKLGQGGMGAVYKAKDTQLGDRLVAIKEMSQQGLSLQEIAEAADGFKREAHMLAGLHHPNLPSIHDYFTEAGHWYLVMSCIEGETLEDYLEAKGGWLPIKEVLDIGMKLCTVLDYLHTHQPKIIFRDLKPSNVIRTSNGYLYLIDFGIARHFKPGQTKDTVSFGSMGYAAPEQYGRAQTTTQSDIYSLGAMLHQLLTGHDPASNAPTPFDFPPLRLHSQLVPASLETLIMQMVEKEAYKRPAGIAVIKQKLQHITAQQTAKMPLPPTSPVKISPLVPYQPGLQRSYSPQQLVVPTPTKRGLTRRTVMVGLVGLVVVGVVGEIWSKQTSNLPVMPDRSTSTVPILAGQSWEGQANQYDYGQYPMILKIAKIQNNLFSGFLHWPSLGDTITNVNGSIVSDFGDSVEQSKWQYVDGFNSGAKGTWLKFIETSFVQGNSVLLNVSYYALAHSDGTIHGVFFLEGASTTKGDFVLYQKI